MLPRTINMKTKTKVEVFFPNQKSLDAALIAISHEGKIETDRSQLKITKNTGKSSPTLILEVSANDIVALRASLNAYLRSLQAFEGIKTQGEEGDS